MIDAHGFAVLCFVVVILSASVYIHLSMLPGDIETAIWLSQCQWNNPEGFSLIDEHQTNGLLIYTLVYILPLKNIAQKRKPWT